MTVPLAVSDELVIRECRKRKVTLTGGTSAGFTLRPSAAATALLRPTLQVAAANDNNITNNVLSVVKTTDGAEGNPAGTNGCSCISLPAGLHLPNWLP